MSNTLIETHDGSHSLFSEQFGVSYHSKYGAIQESQHVFIDAALNYKAFSQKEINVLGIGFGTGLNAFMTLIEAEKQDLTVHYTAIEAYPITLQEARSLNYPTLLKKEAVSSIFLQLHQAGWAKEIALSEYFTFIKYQQKFQDIDFTNQFDIIYFDAFAPNSQPELWEADVLGKMHKALKEGGVLTTYCAKGVVKRTLKAVGFQIESLKGPPGKREMTRGIKRNK